MTSLGIEGKDIHLAKLHILNNFVSSIKIDLAIHIFYFHEFSGIFLQFVVLSFMMKNRLLVTM